MEVHVTSFPFFFTLSCVTARKFDIVVSFSIHRISRSFVMLPYGQWETYVGIFKTNTLGTNAISHFRDYCDKKLITIVMFTDY